MPSTSSWSSLKIVNCWQTIQTAIGLSVPNLCNYTGFSIGYIVYWVILLALIASLVTYLAINRIIDIFQNDVQYAALDLVLITFRLFVIIYAMFDMVFIRRKKLVKLCLFMNDLETSISNNFHSFMIYDESYLAGKFFICFASNMITCTNVVQKENSNYSTNLTILYVQYYQLVASNMIMQVHFYSYRIKSMFDYLNEKIKEISQEKHNNWGCNIINNQHVSTDILFYLRRINDLYKAINMVSQIFYKHFIMIIVCINLNGMVWSSYILKFFTCKRYPGCNFSFVWDCVTISVLKDLVSKRKVK